MQSEYITFLSVCKCQYVFAHVLRVHREMYIHTYLRRYFITCSRVPGAGGGDSDLRPLGEFRISADLSHPICSDVALTPVAISSHQVNLIAVSFAYNQPYDTPTTSSQRSFGSSVFMLLHEHRFLPITRTYPSFGVLPIPAVSKHVYGGRLVNVSWFSSDIIGCIV